MRTDQQNKAPTSDTAGHAAELAPEMIHKISDKEKMLRGRKMFRSLDADGDKYLNKDELLVFARKIGAIPDFDANWPAAYEEMRAKLGFTEAGMDLKTFLRGVPSLAEDVLLDEPFKMSAPTSQTLQDQRVLMESLNKEQAVKQEDKVQAWGVSISQAFAAEAGKSGPQAQAHQKDLKAAVFRKFDVDGDTYLNEDELLFAARRLGFFTGSDAEWPDLYKPMRKELNFPRAGVNLDIFKDGVASSADDRLLQELLQ
jgi:Ca2+-binding EF-hand superfamily protein